jgi:FkbM family methyltransferase
MKNSISKLKRDGLSIAGKKVFFKAISTLGVSKFFSMKRDGMELGLFPTDLTYQLFANKNYKTKEHAFYKQFLQENSTIIDVGANIGTISLTVANIAQRGKVLSFEPSKKFFEILKKNIALNKKESVITPYNIALAKEEGYLGFDEHKKDDTTFSFNELSPHKVKADRLDSFTKHFSTVDLLKIDVEGYEEDVLLGADVTLRKTKVIIIEFITSNLIASKKSGKQVINLLSPHFDLFYYKNEECMPFIFQENEVYELDIVGIAKH